MISDDTGVLLCCSVRDGKRVAFAGIWRIYHRWFIHID
ncbi:hypothetical protein VRK_25790 [Vibrio sp. MEBiC08052]|nr:hypothetical protein VRK_25790 [Vibrio sp. MEBiC08052]